MMTRFHVRNYKALRDATVDLTPIHVLIGPNDSGKTSILEAVASYCRSAIYPLEEAFVCPHVDASLVWRQRPDEAITFEGTFSQGVGSFQYGLGCEVFGEGVRVRSENVRHSGAQVDEPLPSANEERTALFAVVHGEEDLAISQPARELLETVVYPAMADARLCRWDPRALAAPRIPEVSGPFQMDVSGLGLWRLLDDIQGEDRRRLDQIEERFREIFPYVRRIKLIRPVRGDRHAKEIHFELDGGAGTIPASGASDGMLLVLAWLALLNLPTPPRLLLVEEPENGIHPSGLGNVYRIVKDLVDGQPNTQVIVTTHSPYLLDLFAPEEVSVCQRQADGSIRTARLSDSDTVREQLDVFTLGEIWTAEGDEALAASGAAAEATE